MTAPAGGASEESGSGPGKTGALRDVRLCLLGFGSVARSFCELLEQQERILATRHGLRALVTGVGTRRGSLLDPAGMTPGAVLAAVGASPAPPQAPRPAGDLLNASGADVLIEVSVMGDLSGVANGEKTFVPPATAHVLDAFDLGMDVVTANKGPIAWSWPEVSAAATASGRRIRFESTVMDGLPVFSLLEFALPDCSLLGFDAVFNATTNFIVDAMGEGRDFASALAQTQAEGYAEADPGNDIDGWDAASKAAALANVVMDAGITPASVERESLRDVPLERIMQARADGRRLRLVTSVWRETPHGVAPADRTASVAGSLPAMPGHVHARLRAEDLDIEHPLAALSGESLGAVLHTDLMADVVVSERHGLVPQTAYGVYADLLHLCATS